MIEDLTTDPIPPGSILLVEFTGPSSWYSASFTIAAGWIKQGGKVSYNTYAKPPGDIRSQLNRHGLNTEELEKDDKLRIWDGYTLTLGQKSKEKHAPDSMKIAELSIRYAKDFMRQPPQPERLIIVDNMSTLARFNDEKACVEFWLTRADPSFKARKTTGLRGLIRGIHSSWVYEQMEATADGVIDFKLEEAEGETRNLVRVRSMQGMRFDSRWHQVKLGENFEVTLEK